VVRVLREQRAGGGFSFAVERVASREVVGQIRLLDWSRDERRAEVGYWLRRRHWGHGYGTEALRLVCGFGFRTLGLERIAANVVVGNDRSARALERVGFRLEGTSRRAARVANGWADVWNYALLRPEWRRARGAAGDRRRSRPVAGGATADSRRSGRASSSATRKRARGPGPAPAPKSSRYVGL
jgi:RimJ/RimL family protein N-acetyltransferase